MNDDSKYMADFMRGIKIAMAIKGLTNVDVTDKAGIAPNMLSRFKESSKGTNPRLSTLIKLSAALDMSIEQVVALPSRAKELLDAKR